MIYTTKLRIKLGNGAGVKEKSTNQSYMHMSTETNALSNVFLLFDTLNFSYA